MWPFCQKGWIDEGSSKGDGGRFDVKDKAESERVMVVADGVDGEFMGGGVGTDSVGA